MMKRDVETKDPEALPRVVDTIMHTQFKKEKEVVIKRKAKKGSKLMKQPTLSVKDTIKLLPNEGLLKKNEKKEYKVY